MDDASTVRKMLAAGTVSPNAIDPISGETGADPGAARRLDARRRACCSRSPALKLELNAPNGNTALMMAAFKHNKPAVLALLAKGAIVNRPG